MAKIVCASHTLLLGNSHVSQKITRTVLEEFGFQAGTKRGRTLKLVSRQLGNSHSGMYTIGRPSPGKSYGMWPQQADRAVATTFGHHCFTGLLGSRRRHSLFGVVSPLC